MAKSDNRENNAAIENEETIEPLRPYRVFISYSHDDMALVDSIADILKPLVYPVRDSDFRYGHGFHEQIRKFIAHSHVFMPVITKSSGQKGWVHQEIGFAMAMNIPVLPIAVGNKALPSEMIQLLQSVKLDADDRNWAGTLRKQLTVDVFDVLVDDFADPRCATYQCAEDTEDRAQLMVHYANEIRRLGYYATVRQAGALSSFHMPGEIVDHPVWKERYGKLQQGRYRCRWQRLERLALEKHAREKGCKLIVNPEITYEPYGPEARIVRLDWLRRFLKSMPDNDVQIAISPKLHVERSTTIVGDWFAAEAVSAAIGRGYRQTIYTRHAPSVQAKIEVFDHEFNHALQKRNWTPENSRKKMIAYLNRKINSLKAKLSENKPKPGK